MNPLRPTRRRALAPPSTWLVLAASFLIAWTSRAETLDFEALPSGDQPSIETEVLDAYASLGVTFETLNPDEDPKSVTFQRDVSSWPVDGPAAPIEITGFKVGDLSRGRGFDGPEDAFHILATFSGPVTEVSADVYAAWGEGDRTTVTLVALDDGGNELASATSAPNASHPFKGNLSLRGVGPIAAVYFVTSDPFGSSPWIDNLTFFTPGVSPGANPGLALR